LGLYSEILPVTSVTYMAKSYLSLLLPKIKPYHCKNNLNAGAEPILETSYNLHLMYSTITKTFVVSWINRETIFMKQD